MTRALAVSIATGGSRREPFAGRSPRPTLAAYARLARVWLRLAAAAVLLPLAACAVRSPEMYRNDTRKLLETRQPSLQACYDAELQSDRSATGKVIVRFTVEESTGKILKPEIDDLQSTPNRTLRGCVLDSLKGLTLDPPDDRDGDATFTWEFQLPHT